VNGLELQSAKQRHLLPFLFSYRPPRVIVAVFEDAYPGEPAKYRIEEKPAHHTRVVSCNRTAFYEAEILHQREGLPRGEAPGLKVYHVPSGVSRFRVVLRAGYDLGAVQWRPEAVAPIKLLDYMEISAP
jgi:hypothetical protein